MVKIIKLPDCVTRIETDQPSLDVLQISDVHYDSMKCDRELLTKHLKEAEKRGAFVFINGDFFDVMQGKYDPRRTYDSIRPEYVKSNYLDEVVNDAVEYLSGFGVSYFFSEGNHESNIRERLSTDLIDRLVHGLKSNGVNCERGMYKGWLIWVLTHGTARIPVRQHYHHGHGGNAPRSKGVLRVDIQMKNYPDADIITRGHDHNKWHIPSMVERLKGQGMKMRRMKKKVHNIQTGSYKKLGDAGWAVEKGFAEPTLGGYWTTLTAWKPMNKLSYKIEVTEAQ